jgi:hypothetical protein
MRQLRLSLLLLVSVLGTASGLSAQAEAEDHRSARQIADSAEIAALAHTLVRAHASDSARAAALYQWVAQNIRYDAREFFRGGKSHEQAEAVYRNRLAFCGGFVSIYERLAREIGLTAVPIIGYAKGIDYRFGRSTKKPNHAWLAMHIAGAWRLIDPTWGAGVIIGRTFEPRFTWDFFLVAPDELILSHFPDEAEWQLLDTSLDRRDFERMHAVPRALFDVGFDPDDVRRTALRPGVKDFPLIGTLGSHVRVVRAPIAGTLATAAPISVEVIWPGAFDVALVTNGEWTKLSRTGDRFSGQVAAAGSSVSLVGRATGGPTPYLTLLHYRVASDGQR